METDDCILTVLETVSSISAIVMAFVPVTPALMITNATMQTCRTITKVCDKTDGPLDVPLTILSWLSIAAPTIAGPTRAIKAQIEVNRALNAVTIAQRVIDTTKRVANLCTPSRHQSDPNEPTWVRSLNVVQGTAGMVLPFVIPSQPGIDRILNYTSAGLSFAELTSTISRWQ